MQLIELEEKKKIEKNIFLSNSFCPLYFSRTISHLNYASFVLNSLMLL
jgi:hypothetical protein